MQNNHYKKSEFKQEDSILMLSPAGERHAIAQLDTLLANFPGQSIMLWLREINDTLVSTNSRTFVIRDLYLEDRRFCNITFHKHHLIYASALVLDEEKNQHVS
jgi:hypothetical protein